MGILEITSGDGGGVSVVALAFPMLLLHSSRTELSDGKTTQMMEKRQVSAGGGWDVAADAESDRLTRPAKRHLHLLPGER